MQLTRKLVVAASAITLVGSFGVASSVQAKTAHCPAGDKVELDGSSSTVQTNLPAGTVVCIKAGTSVDFVVVGSGGVLENDVIFNQNGNARGISYYVSYDGGPS
jgi:hypothetical protein